MTAATKPQTKYHIAQVQAAKLKRIEATRAEALADMPKFVNEKFDKKRSAALAAIPDDVVPMMVAGSDATAAEIEAAKLAALEAETAPTTDGE